jgi:hypothetical protein
VSGSASDSAGVISVSLYINGVEIATDTSSPYSFTFDTAKYANGSLSLQLKADDNAGNVGSSSVVTVTVDNQTNSGSSGSSSGGGSTSGSSPTSSSPVGDTSTTISANNTSPLAVSVSGKLTIHPSVPGQSVQLSVDGRSVNGDSIDTGKLTNGTHMVTITEDGKTIQQKILVHNPWPTAIHNEFEAHETAYTTGTGGVVLLAVVSAWIFRRAISSWLLKHLRIRKFSRFGLK